MATDIREALRATTEQLSNIEHVNLLTKWDDGRASEDMWKVASFSRFGPAELVLRFVNCGYDLKLTETDTVVLKDGKKVGSVVDGKPEASRRELQSTKAVEFRQSRAAVKRRLLRRAGGADFSTSTLSVSSGANRGGND